MNIKHEPKGMRMIRVRRVSKLFSGKIIELGRQSEKKDSTRKQLYPSFSNNLRQNILSIYLIFFLCIIQLFFLRLANILPSLDYSTNPHLRLHLFPTPQFSSPVSFHLEIFFVLEHSQELQQFSLSFQIAFICYSLKRH